MMWPQPSLAAYLLTAEARRTPAWFERPVVFAGRRTPTVLAAEWRLAVLRAAARGASDAICFFGRCRFLFLASARDLSVSLRCASALAFLQMSLMEGVSATGTAASSFVLDRPPTPSQGASPGNSMRKETVLASSTQFSAGVPVILRT